MAGKLALEILILIIIALGIWFYISPTQFTQLFQPLFNQSTSLSTTTTIPRGLPPATILSGSLKSQSFNINSSSVVNITGDGNTYDFKIKAGSTLYLSIFGSQNRITVNNGKLGVLISGQQNEVITANSIVIGETIIDNGGSVANQSS